MAPHSSTLDGRAWCCSPWGHCELDTTERLRFHFSLLCIGEGNDIPLQCSCLENPREGEAWWVAVYGVAQSQTWLKWLSSNSSRVNSVLNRLFKFSCRPYDVAAIIDIMQHKLKESGIRFNHMLSHNFLCPPHKQHFKNPIVWFMHF